MIPTEQGLYYDKEHVISKFPSGKSLLRQNCPILLFKQRTVRVLGSLWKVEKSRWSAQVV